MLKIIIVFYKLLYHVDVNVNFGFPSHHWLPYLRQLSNYRVELLCGAGHGVRRAILSRKLQNAGHLSDHFPQWRRGLLRHQLMSGHYLIWINDVLLDLLNALVEISPKISSLSDIFAYLLSQHGWTLWRQIKRLKLQIQLLLSTSLIVQATQSMSCGIRAENRGNLECWWVHRIVLLCKERTAFLIDWWIGDWVRLNLRSDDVMVHLNVCI